MGCRSSVIAPAPDDPVAAVPLTAPEAGGVDADWVTRALRSGPERLELDIESVDVLPVLAPMQDGTERADGGGISGSRIVRLRLHYAPHSQRRLPGGADTLIYKWTDWQKVPPVPLMGRILMEIGGGFQQVTMFRCERYFMHELKPTIEDCGIRLPRMYWCNLRDGTDPCKCCRVLCESRAAVVSGCLLQDLCPPPEISKGVRRYRSLPAFGNCGGWMPRAALMNVARLHRATWGNFAQHVPVFQKLWGWEQGVARLQTNFFAPRNTPSWSKKAAFESKPSMLADLRKNWVDKNDPRGDALLQGYKDLFGDPAVIAALEDLQRRMPELLPRLGRWDPQCLVHGDFHHWNNMFAEDGSGEDDVMLVDWQAIGTGRSAYEVMYFIVNSCDPVSAAADHDLLAAYHAAFEAAPGGPADYGLEAFLRDCDLALIDGALTQLVTFSQVATPKLMLRLKKMPKQEDLANGSIHSITRLFRRIVWLCDSEWIRVAAK